MDILDYLTEFENSTNKSYEKLNQSIEIIRKLRENFLYIAKLYDKKILDAILKIDMMNIKQIIVVPEKDSALVFTFEKGKDKVLQLKVAPNHSFPKDYFKIDYDE